MGCVSQTHNISSIAIALYHSLEVCDCMEMGRTSIIIFSLVPRLSFLLGGRGKRKESLGTRLNNIIS